MRRPRREIEELPANIGSPETVPVPDEPPAPPEPRRFSLDVRIVVALLAIALAVPWLITRRSHSTTVASVHQDDKVRVAVDGPVVLRLDHLVQDGSHLTADFWVREPADARLIQSLVVVPETPATGPNAEPIRVSPSSAAAQSFSISTFDLPRRDQRITKLSITEIDFALPGDASWTIDLSPVWPTNGGARGQIVDREIQAGGVTLKLEEIVGAADRVEFDVGVDCLPAGGRQLTNGRDGCASVLFEPSLTIGGNRLREAADTAGPGPRTVVFKGLPPDARMATFTLDNLTESVTGPWSWTLNQ